MTHDPLRSAAPMGRLGVLTVGMGSLSSTLIAGVFAVRRKLGMPVGSLTQMGRLTEASGKGEPVPIAEAVPLAPLDSLVFGGWDVLPDDAYSAACKAEVLDKGLLSQLRPELEAVRPWPGIFDPRYVRRIEPSHIRRPGVHMANVEAVESDIQSFRQSTGAERLVLLNTASTEVFQPLEKIHSSQKLFENGLRDNDDRISPSMIYAYAALRQRVGVVNCTPSRGADIPALLEMAPELGVPVAGRDLKTGQTLLKTVLAPALKIRALGLAGWYSTNILGNRDGEVLDDPECLRAKQESKLSVLRSILDPDLYPDLYGRYDHRVRIDYYRPRKDNKEAWDSIDIFGWLGYSMQIKINFLCRDSILAAPLALDLALFLDLAKRADMRGPQEWLSLYFKSPTSKNGQPSHDLFAQHRLFEHQLRRCAGWNASERDGRPPRHR